MTAKAKKTAPRKVAKTSDPRPHAALPLSQRSSFTIEEFCARNDIAEGTYRSLRAAGLGPKEMRPTGMRSGSIRISLASEQAWQRKAEDPEALVAEKAIYQANARAAKNKKVA
jgi:hypothetical protein